MPDPRVVVAFGVCSSTGGIFADGYNVLGGIDKVIPVDVFVPGCPPRPEAMIDGIVQAAVILESRRTAAITSVSASQGCITRTPAPPPVAVESV
jgi:ech hydrogenase subunit C